MRRALLLCVAVLAGSWAVGCSSNAAPQDGHAGDDSGMPEEAGSSNDAGAAEASTSQDGSPTRGQDASGTTDAGAETLGGLSVTSVLTVTPATVTIGQTVTATATLHNAASAAISIDGASIAGRPPGGTNSGGPFDDFYDGTAVTVAPGQDLVLTGTRTLAATDPVGTWYAYVTVEDAAGAYHDSAHDVSFTVKAASSPPPTGGFGVKVSGNKLVSTANGSTVVLHGADVSGFEFAPMGGTDPSAVLSSQTGSASPWSAITSWKMNAVRIPLNEDAWLGWTSPCTNYSNGEPGFPSGATISIDDTNYQQVVEQAVAAATAAGLYVILDLHWTAPGTLCAVTQDALPDADNAGKFWTSVATAFKDNPAVLFDIFNEPYAVLNDGNPADDWNCLLNGCSLSNINIWVSQNNAAFLYPYNWQTAGMQSLLDAIRATGATNVLLAGGLDGAGDSSMWLQYHPVDPLDQLALSWHAYSFPSNDQSVQAILAAGFPVIIGECGAGSASNVSQVAAWAATNGASVLVWTWDTWGSGTLISDGSGTPASGMGTTYYDWLQGQ